MEPVQSPFAGKRGSQVESIPHNTRLKWSDKLHEHFLAAVYKLGGPFATKPRDILREMNVPGLLLTHVKSHLQKYRLTLRPTPVGYQQYPSGHMHGWQPYPPPPPHSASGPPMIQHPSMPPYGSLHMPGMMQHDVHKPTAYYPTGYPAPNAPSHSGWIAPPQQPSSNLDMDRVASLASGPSAFTTNGHWQNNTQQIASPGFFSSQPPVTQQHQPPPPLAATTTTQNLDPVKLLNRIQGLINNLTSAGAAPDQVSESCHQQQGGLQPLTAAVVAAPGGNQQQEQQQNTNPAAVQAEENNKPEEEVTSPPVTGVELAEGLRNPSLRSDQTTNNDHMHVASPTNNNTQQQQNGAIPPAVTIARGYGTAAHLEMAAARQESKSRGQSPLAEDAPELKLLRDLLTTVNALASKMDGADYQQHQQQAANQMPSVGGGAEPETPQELLNMLLTLANSQGQPVWQ